MSKANSTLPGLGSLGDMLANNGLAGMLGVDDSKPVHTYAAISDIKVMPQHRGTDAMEDSEQTIEELAADIRAQGVLQPIIVCVNTSGGPEDLRLIAGERRIRAAIMAGESTISAMAYGELNEEQIDRIQYSENVLRLNLKQIEEAKVLAKDLEELGRADLVAAKRNKSAAWVSKRLALLNLESPALRLVTENVSGDVEVINQVNQIAKLDPKAATELVDTLKKEEPGKGSARQAVKKVKDQVKPPKPKKEKEESKNKKAPANPENVATPRDTSHQEHGQVVSLNPWLEDGAAENAFAHMDDDFAGAKLHKPSETDAEQNSDYAYGQNIQDNAPELSDSAPALPPQQLLSSAYTRIVSGESAKSVLEKMSDADREDCTKWLNTFYELAIEAAPNTLARAVARSLANNTFTKKDHGFFAMMAFLIGSEEGGIFNLQDILACASAKP
jgi:ParB family chromosome partitioning protein